MIDRLLLQGPGTVAWAALKASERFLCYEISQSQKLAQEIRKLQLANQGASSTLHYLVALAPALVGVAAILTFGLGWSNQRSQSRRQQEQDRDQRKVDKTKEFDSQFASVVANLGSDSLSLQASAASVLAVYADGRYPEFGSHIIRVTIANLRLPKNIVVRDLLVDVLGVALRREANEAVSSGEVIDMSRADLEGLNISGVKLREKFIATEANLRSGRLESCDLWKANFQDAILDYASLRQTNLGQARLDGARLSHAVLHGSRATSASLRRIDGRYTMLQGASLQSAHFEHSDLRGARFDGADLADCYFQGAKLDTGGLQSILKTRNWRKAHFDESDLEKLLSLRNTGAVPGS
jgi:uncharacterized protein YjbI with pentapeptide repeats